MFSFNLKNAPRPIILFLLFSTNKNKKPIIIHLTGLHYVSRKHIIVRHFDNKYQLHCYRYQKIKFQYLNYFLIKFVSIFISFVFHFYLRVVF